MAVRIFAAFTLKAAVTHAESSLLERDDGRTPLTARHPVRAHGALHTTLREQVVDSQFRSLAR
jgi:hypothetical protein